MGEPDKDKALDRLSELVEFSKDYWEHRKDYYRNRQDVDVDLARIALEHKP